MSAASHPQAYEALRAQARRLARAILAQPSPGSAQLSYLCAEAARLAKAAPEYRGAPPECLAGEILAYLADHAADLFADGGVARAKRGLISRFGVRYWETLMTSFPMQTYATLAADLFLERGLERGSCLELGAGTGNFSRLVHGSIRDYVRTDKEPLILDPSLGGETARLDFDEPFAGRRAETIVAVNALHCARDKGATLRYLFEALVSGGTFLLAEGADPVRSDEPWCLNLLFGLYDGWWDRGGFLPRDRWRELLRAAGFVGIEERPWVAGEYDWGGLLVARKPG